MLSESEQDEQDVDEDEGQLQTSSEAVFVVNEDACPIILFGEEQSAADEVPLSCSGLRTAKWTSIPPADSVDNANPAPPDSAEVQLESDLLQTKSASSAHPIRIVHFNVGKGFGLKVTKLGRPTIKAIPGYLWTLVSESESAYCL